MGLVGFPGSIHCFDHGRGISSAGLSRFWFETRTVIRDLMLVPSCASLAFKHFQDYRFFHEATVKEIIGVGTCSFFWPSQGVPALSARSF